MKSHKPERKLDLTPTQVTGSALAAMSGAFFASWAGTTGTIIGAALGSVIVTVGAATYTWSLQRTRDAVRRTAAQVRQQALTANAQPQRVADGPLREPETPEPADTSAYAFLYAAPTTSVSPALPSQPTAAPRPRGRFDLAGLPWPRLLLASAAVTVATLLGITAIEAVAGRPVSSFTGGDSTGTTLGSTFGGSEAGTDSTADDTASSGSSGSSDSPSDDTGTGTDTGAGSSGDTGTGTTGEDEAGTTEPESPQPTTEPTPAPVDPETPAPDPEPSTAP